MDKNDRPIDKARARLPMEMNRALEVCSQRCQLIVGDLQQMLAKQPAPAAIYHYTDSQGLLGILESGKLQLTNIFGLNDPSELRHGVDLACDVLAAEGKVGHPIVEVFAERFMKLRGEVSRVVHVFVACFSRDGDELGQWRAYGDNGRGFALGFDGGKLEESFATPGGKRLTNNLTFPVTYDDAALVATHRKLVSETLPLLSMSQGKNLSNDVINEFMRMLTVNLAVSVVAAAALFKHPAYASEQEYRFLHLRGINDPVDDLKHRARRNSLIRFIDFDWKTGQQDVLRDVVIGPAADRNASESFIQECLRAGGFDPKAVTVRQSGIPYRST